MAGIVEMFNDRKAYFQSLRQNDPKAYMDKMQKSSAELTTKLGADTRNNGLKVITAINGRARDEKGRFTNKVNEDRKQAQETRILARDQRTATNFGTMKLSSEIDNLRTELAALLKKQIELLKSMQPQGEGLIPSLLDMFGGKGRRGRGRGGRGGRGAGRGNRGPGRSPGPGGSPPPRPPARSGTLRNNALTRAGGRALGAVSTFGTNTLASVRGAASSARAAGGRALGTAGNVLGSVGGVASKALGPALAIGLGAKEGYELLSDEEKTAKEKGLGTAKIAGGIAGAQAGATGGAALGATLGSVVPGFGTAAGGIVGGLLGGIGGYFAGSGLAETIGDTLTGSIEKSGVGKVLGFSAAAAMSPFSKEAREALVMDFNNTILPGFKETFLPVTRKLTEFGETFSAYKDAFTDVGKNLAETAGSVGSTLFSGLKKAYGQVSAGYQSGGIRGAIGSAGEAASTIGTAASGAGSTIVKSARDASAKVGSVGKVRQSTLDLAVGFKSENVKLRGLSDAQSRALAAETARTESGGDISAENQYGYIGRYQFGADALSDTGLVSRKKLDAAKAAAKAQGRKFSQKDFLNDDSNFTIPGGKAAFLGDADLQDKAYGKLTNLNLASGFRSGALSDKSAPEDIAGYIKAAHLGGAGSANKYFKQGIEFKDANGTPISKYAAQGAQSISNASQIESALAAKGKAPVTQVATLSGKIVPATEVPKIAETSAPALSMSAKVPLKASATMGSVASPKKEAEVPLMMTAAMNPASAPNTSGSPKASYPLMMQKPTTEATSMVMGPANASEYANNTMTAKAYQAPLAMLDKKTPAEVASVRVTNPNTEQGGVNSQPRGGVQSVTKGSAYPDLSEIPVFFPDMALVPLLIGRT